MEVFCKFSKKNNNLRVNGLLALPFSSRDLGRRNGIVTVVSAVSMGAEEGLDELVDEFIRLIKEGVLGASGFVASSSLNCTKTI